MLICIWVDGANINIVETILVFVYSKLTISNNIELLPTNSHFKINHISF